MRAFIAIDLPDDLKEKIFVFSQQTARDLDMKVVEEENLHLTVLFLGEIDERGKEKILNLLEKLEYASRRTGEIRLRLGKVEVFPDKKRPRGIWINLEGETEKLFSLYKKIVDGLLKDGVALQEKNLKFSPHITIGRFRNPRCKIKSGNWVEKWELEKGKAFSVGKVVLFQSQLLPKGPKYTKIAEFEVK